MSETSGQNSSATATAVPALADAARLRPFQPGTDPRVIWLGGQYGEALDSLRATALGGGGALVLTGEVGTGKTILANTLVERLRGEGVIVGRVDYPCGEPLELFHGVAEAYHLTDAFSGRDAFFASLNEFLAGAHAARKRVLLVIEEAQGLGRDLFPEIASLVEAGRQTSGTVASALNVLLVGQDDLETILAAPEGQALVAQIATHCHLRPLTEDEVGEYIAFRLANAGLARDLFTPLALAAVAEATRGIPRLINTICDHALATAAREESPVVSVEVVRECAEEITPERETPAAPARPRESTVAPRTREPRSRGRRRARTSWTPGLIATALGVAILALVAGHLLRQSRLPKEPAPTATQPQRATEQTPATATAPAPAAPASNATTPEPASKESTAVGQQTPTETPPPAATPAPVPPPTPAVATPAARETPARPAPRAVEPAQEKRPVVAAPTVVAPKESPPVQRAPAVSTPAPSPVPVPTPPAARPAPSAERPAVAAPRAVEMPRPPVPEPRPQAAEPRTPSPEQRPQAVERPAPSAAAPAPGSAPAARSADEGPDPTSIIDWLLKESPRRFE
jgi:general secretion pathway protein A